jgi:hypothetical protein
MLLTSRGAAETCGRASRSATIGAAQCWCRPGSEVEKPADKCENKEKQAKFALPSRVSQFVDSRLDPACMPIIQQYKDATRSDFKHHLTVTANAQRAACQIPRHRGGKARMVLGQHLLLCRHRRLAAVKASVVKAVVKDVPGSSWGG